MAKANLSRMTVEALMDLRKRVDEMLLKRRAEIEKQLERMGGAIAVVTWKPTERAESRDQIP
jgi:hypothetical protein